LLPFYLLFESVHHFIRIDWVKLALQFKFTMHRRVGSVNFCFLTRKSKILLISAIILLRMPQGAGEHKKSNQGFASGKYHPEKKRAAQSRGGMAKVPKGFARMSPERRREVARKGGLA
jgi:Stress-induced bacterial acidophilic repeat motif